MSGTSLEPISGTPKDPVPWLQQRVELLEGEVRMLHGKLVAAYRELALLRDNDSQLAMDELLAELERAEKLRLEREREQVEAQAAAEAESEAIEAEEVTPAKPVRRGHGPRPQPHLPVLEEIFELKPDECKCKVCDGELVPLGDQFEEYEEITVLERRYFKKVHKRRKYRCRCNSCVETAPAPARLIPGGRYSLDFAVHVAVNKYLDHLPLERQVRMMARHGLESSSQALWDQLNALADTLKPTYDALGQLILKAPVLHADESRWPMLDGPGRSPWAIWARTTPEIAHYAILSSKTTKAARRLFSGFKGVVVVDGYQVYEKLVKEAPLLWSQTPIQLT